jgi:hypothetical protein
MMLATESRAIPTALPTPCVMCGAEKAPFGTPATDSAHMPGWTAQGILTQFEADIIDAHAELKELRAKVGSLRERNSLLEAQQRAEAVQVRALRAHFPSSSRVSH